MGFIAVFVLGAVGPTATGGGKLAGSWSFGAVWILSAISQEAVEEVFLRGLPRSVISAWRQSTAISFCLNPEFHAKIAE